MWSIWPCVKNIALTISFLSARYSVFGMIKSMPGMSPSGKRTPASIKMISSSYWIADILRPTSPRPPRCTILRPPSLVGRGALSSARGKILMRRTTGFICWWLRRGPPGPPRRLGRPPLTARLSSFTNVSLAGRLFCSSDILSDDRIDQLPGLELESESTNTRIK